MDNTEKAFERLVAEQKGTIYSVCLMFAADSAEADDMFQEVLINLWKGFPSFRGESSVRTWVHRAALNTCISYNRKARRRKAAELEIEAQFLAPESPVGRQVEMLRARISCLEPFDRAIVLLWLENLSYEEIGQIVGIPARHVGVKLVRIREKLKNSK
ncbi:MAG: sigma-70 family RNA polymerase sigma factor [Muribaculaceae bacterium]|nr:sigma-70 family RNA polymerase sigma factor [Muribaculaceae bacterium]